MANSVAPWVMVLPFNCLVAILILLALVKPSINSAATTDVKGVVCCHTEEDLKITKHSFISCTLYDSMGVLSGNVMVRSRELQYPHNGGA